MSTSHLALVATLAVGLLAPACGPARPMNGPTIDRTSPAAPSSRVVSSEILAREAVANKTRVKHILIGWKDLAEAYQGGIDPRAAARSKADAEAQVDAIVAELRGGADFDAMMKQHSEDRGSASNPDGYEVYPGAQLVLEFRQLGLRLHRDEIGVVESSYGFHVMKRVE